MKALGKSVKQHDTIPYVICDDGSDKPATLVSELNHVVICDWSTTAVLLFMSLVSPQLLTFLFMFIAPIIVKEHITPMICGKKKH